MTKRLSLNLSGLAVLALLSACGGGGGSSGSDGNSNVPLPSPLPPSASLANQCAQPRPGTVDRQGSMSTEKAYLRSFIDETYLWYRDVPANLNPDAYNSTQAYFDVLKTNAVTASGKLVDQFHFYMLSADWQASLNGISQDYGIQWAAFQSSPPRNYLVADVAPNSPAALAGVVRGDKITLVDGVDFVNDNTSTGIATLNQGLFPSSIAAHQLVFNGSKSVTMTPANYTVQTVQNVKVIPTANGNVGYFIFNSHIIQSEGELIKAISQLQAANVSDLIIDLRYNGGGLLAVASELAYMIAGPANTNNLVFEKLIYNDKLTSQNQTYPFYNTSSANQPLPTLNLNKVSLLVGPGTASASESIINSLRGVNVAVNLIGATTRGKPYGFVPQDNCSYTYFSIQFKGANNKGYGDYADGFAPTCPATDDFTHQRGDVNETLLKTALSYRVSGACPASGAGASVLQDTSEKYEVIRPLPELRIPPPLPHT